MLTLIRLAVLLAATLGAAEVIAAPQDPAIHHDIDVRIHPENGSLAGRTEVTFRNADAISRGSGGGFRFTICESLSVLCLDSEWALSDLGTVPGSGSPESGIARHAFEVARRDGKITSGSKVRLSFSGKIDHALQTDGEEYARGFSSTDGIIGEQGVFLSGASYWMPSFGSTLFNFRLHVSLPEGVHAVSQGKRIAYTTNEGRSEVTWDCPKPMEEAYIIANRFHQYERMAGDVVARVYLRTPDPNLANKYLEATAQYIAMYRQLLGAYPFTKFAMVENFWETGYGMPSFTLLGSSVIRFPFILTSSYPHEILHNWWGNSVYVDYATGNWCEGLTAYLADHLLKEGLGQGINYRRDSLKKYRDYVMAGLDFPLSDFRSRHSAATEAVGYGKALMVFHMLRQELGDSKFAAALRRFYSRNLYRRASWTDIEKVFSETAGRDLSAMFDQWILRTGAPELAMTVERTVDGDLTITVTQTQEEAPYVVNVPVAITLAGEEAVHIETLSLREREHAFSFQFDRIVRRVQLDPYFDVFRRLDREELPPTLGEVFGASAVTIVLPQKDRDAWRAIAEAWAQSPGDYQIVHAEELQAIPKDRAMWVLGSKNPYAETVLRALPGDRFDEQQPELSRVYIARHPADPNLAIGLVTTDVSAAIPGLGRKLPHYGKYGYLGFTGDEPTNIIKGQWIARSSPLVAYPENPSGSLPEREPITRPAPVFDPGQMKSHVSYLASDDLEGRGVGTAGLERAAEYIAEELAQAGLKPGGDDGTPFQTWTESNGPGGNDATLKNVVFVLPGTDPKFEGQSVVIGAHYDHLGRGWPDVRSGNEGQIHNGADDNASGVAVLIEVARLLASEMKPLRTLVFVAFSGEEWGLKGSQHFLETAKLEAESAYPADKIFAMVNLDTVGRFDEGGLTVFGSNTATEWVHIARGVGFTTGVQSTCVPTDPGGSDQVSFHKAGIPAVQLFTGATADYHRPSDDADGVGADGLVQVATWLRETVVYLSEREAPMTSTLGGSSNTTAPTAASGERQVSLGTVPAFDHTGPGVLVSSVVEGSPAEAAGIQGGDILLAINEADLADLRAFSDALKRCAPGDVVRMKILRDGKEQVLKATLVAR